MKNSFLGQPTYGDLLLLVPSASLLLPGEMVHVLFCRQLTTLQQDQTESWKLSKHFHNGKIAESPNISEDSHCLFYKEYSYIHWSSNQEM